MKWKGHQFSNLSQSPFLSVLFKGQVSFALENLKPVVPSCPWFDPPDRTIVRSGGSNHGCAERNNCWQKKDFFEGTQQKMQTKKNLFFVNHFFQSLPGIPSRRARQQVSIFWRDNNLPSNTIRTSFKVYLFVLSPTGIEPVFPPWKGEVLTTRRKGHFS